MIHLEIELPRGSLFSTAACRPFEVESEIEKQRLLQASFISGEVFRKFDNGGGSRFAIFETSAMFSQATVAAPFGQDGIETLSLQIQRVH